MPTEMRTNRLFIGFGCSLISQKMLSPFFFLSLSTFLLFVYEVETTHTAIFRNSFVFLPRGQSETGTTWKTALSVLIQLRDLDILYYSVQSKKFSY